MEELIKRLERVIQTGAPDKDGMHPISAEAVLEVVRGLSEHGTNLAEVGTDCISRQAAIDLLKQMRKDGGMIPWEGKDVFARIRKLPSAQPETHEERTETHSCDCISRQSAIDAHYEYCNKHPDAGFPVWSLKILEDLPSAQSERQKGEWIDYTEDGYVECPFCHSATNCDGNKDELHFCFSCGADMRGKQE